MIAFEPGERIPFTLPRHKNTPEADRPTFIVAAPASRVQRQWRKLAAQVYKTFDEIDATKDDLLHAEILDRRVDLCKEMARLGVVGWRNIKVEFSPDALNVYMDTVMPDQDITDLAFGWVKASQVSEDDVKNSQSPPQSGVENSAPVATAGV